MLLREYAFFSRYVEQFRHCNIFGDEVALICSQFAREFAEIHCDIQAARLENDDLIDSYAARVEALRKMERQVLDKANLISVYDSRLKSEGGKV